MHFHDWELRGVERKLLVRGEPVTIGSRAFDVLLALAESHGKVVTKAQLLVAAWPGLIVEENNVSVQIATLRKVLGANAIATVSGLGYRLSVVAEPVLSSHGDAPTRTTMQGNAPAPPSLLPAVLVGRDTEIESLTRQVGVLPLVSIIGTGGVGKTSLAKAVLSVMKSHGMDSIHWIDLAPLRDAGQLISLVAKSLGVELGGSAQPREDLISALKHTSALIAVDNCEHLVGEVGAIVRESIERAAGIHWLATSQEPLHVAGEAVYRLEPLDIPSPHATLDDAMAHGALELLCRRAVAADRHFELNASNLATAIDLCRQLDGLPLAIEMASARIATLGLHGVHQQLGRRLHLLAGRRDGPARHHTLRSTFDWSYALLSEPEQHVFRRLEPFIGGFRMEMAQELSWSQDDASGPLDVLESLSALVDKSLVHRSAEYHDRFFLLDSVREYSRQRAVEAGESELLKRRHAHIVADWFDRSANDYERLRDDEWGALYVPERHNVRAALVWTSKAHDPDLLARLVASLARIDLFIRDQSESLQCGVPISVLDQAEPSLRAPACLEFSWVHFLDGSRKTGTHLALRALEDFREAGDRAGEYRALSQLIRLYESRPGTLEQARHARELLRGIDSSAIPLRTYLFCAIPAGLQYGGDRSVARLQELEQIASRAGFDTLAAVCRAHITDEMLIEGRFEDAVVAASQFVAAGERQPRVNATLLINKILALVQLGRTAEAVEPARAALRALPSASYLVLDAFAYAASCEGRLVDAGLIAGHCERARQERDELPDPAEARVIAATRVALLEGLGTDRLDELTRAGSAMTIVDVLTVAGLS